MSAPHLHKVPLQKTLAASRKRGDSSAYKKKVVFPRYVRVQNVSVPEAIAHFVARGFTEEPAPVTFSGRAPPAPCIRST